MYTKQVTIRLDENLYRLLEKEAGKQMRSVAGLARLILHRNLKNTRTNSQTGSNRVDKTRNRGTEE